MTYDRGDVPSPERHWSARRSLTIAVALLVLVGGCLWLWWGRTAGGPAIERIVLISIDTCRADHLSCYGYGRPTTPRIDGVARKAVRFRNVLSPVPMTLPAHATMLTGTNPPHHGIHDNLRYRLSPSNVTLAEWLRPHGFVSGAIVSTFVLDGQFGLDQGFDTYHDRFERPSVQSVTAERKGGEATRLAEAWLQEHRDERFFLFLHYYDPHDAYEPPEPYATRFADHPYAGEIAFTDHCVGQVIDKLAELGIYDSTLLIITADHGEMLGEHGEPTHAYFIYQSALKVPLIFKLPDPGASRGAARAVDRLVGIVDIVPTICGLLGIDAPPDVAGIDLSDVLRGGRMPPDDRLLYCESVTPADYGCNTLGGVVGNRWKLIRTTRPELYDLEQDPGESTNLVEKMPGVAVPLRKALDRILREQHRDDPEARAHLDAASLRTLESLGYAGGANQGRDDPSGPRDDPKDFIGFYNAFGRVPALVAQRRYDEAAAVCRKLVAQRPGFLIGHLKLMQLATKRGDHAAVLAHGRQALDIHPDHARVLNGMGIALAALGRPNEAIERYEQALRADPGLSDAHCNLGIALAAKGRHEDAIRHYRTALERNPKSAEAHCNLGVTLSAMGKHAEAIEHDQRALALKLDYPDAHRNMASALGRLGRHDEAVRAYEAALRSEPDHADTHHNLGLTLVKLGRDADAIASFQSYVSLKPGVARGHLNLGVAFSKAGRPDDAIAALKRAVELDAEGKTGRNAKRYLQILRDAPAP